VLPAEEGLPGPASRRVDEATRDRGQNLAQERAENLEHDRDALLESMAAKVPEDLDGLTGDQRNKVYRMLGLVITPAAEGYRGHRGAERSLVLRKTTACATVKKLKGARSRSPSGPAVEVQAIWRETTEPMRSLQRPFGAKFRGAMITYRLLLVARRRPRPFNGVERPYGGGCVRSNQDDLVANIAAEELGHVELVANTINLLLDQLEASTDGVTLPLNFSG
jgi:hypothetical protein